MANICRIRHNSNKRIDRIETSANELLRFLIYFSRFLSVLTLRDRKQQRQALQTSRGRPIYCVFSDNVAVQA